MVLEDVEIDVAIRGVLPEDIIVVGEGGEEDAEEEACCCEKSIG